MDVFWNDPIKFLVISHHDYLSTSITSTSYYRGRSPGCPLPLPAGGGGCRFSVFLLSPAKFTSKDKLSFNKWQPQCHLGGPMHSAYH